MKRLLTTLLAAGFAFALCGASAIAAENIDIDLDDSFGRLEITEDGSYILTGRLDGSVYVDPGEGAVELVLDGVDINGAASPGILAVSGDSLTITLPEGSVNRISGSGGNMYEATIYSSIDTCFEGEGALYVNSESANGIFTEDADLTFNGGSYAIKAEENAVAAPDGQLTVNDGHFSTQAENAVNPDANFAINGGMFEQSLPAQMMNGDMQQNGQPPQMNGDMQQNGHPPQMNGNMAQGSAEAADSPSEIVYGTMANNAADLKEDYANATYISITDEDSQVKITSSGTYVISGSSSDGNITVKKGTTGVVLVLDDLDLTSNTGATVSVNKEAEVKIIISGNVVLTDNENPDDEYSSDADVADAYDGAALKAKAGSQVYVTGDGTLTINGNAKNGIKAGDDTGLIIDGVTVNITAANDGINGNYDVTLLSGTFNIAAGDDAIHADHILTIGSEDGTGPAINVTQSTEGLEGTVVNVLGGDVSIVSSDDAINAANGDGTYEGELDYSFNMTGGKVTANSSGDGIDSNGNVNLIGGSAQINSASNGGEAGIDYDGQYYISDSFSLNNRSGVSGADMMPGGMNGMQPR